MPIDEAVLLRWRQLVEAGRKRGHTYSEPDVLIAAAALIEQLVVVTRDTGEFIEAGVPVLDPWKGALTAPGKVEKIILSLDRRVLLETLQTALTSRYPRPTEILAPYRATPAGPLRFKR